MRAGAIAVWLACLVLLPASARAVSQAGAIVDTFSPSARGTALAHAAGVAPEGPFAIRWNPAGLALEQPMSFGVTHSKLVPDFADDIWILHVGGTAKVGPVGFGAHYARLDQGEFGGFTEGDSWESAFRFGAAVDVFELIDTDYENHRVALTVGAAAKRLKVHLAPARVTSDLGSGGGGGEASSWTMDTGALFRFGRFVGLGADSPAKRSYVGMRASVVYDCLINDELEFPDADQRDPLPQRLRYGAALEANLFPTEGIGHLVDLLFLYERLDSKVERDDTRTYSFGLEMAVANTLILRGGSYDDGEGMIVAGTYGVGLRLSPASWKWGVQVDYASRPQATGLGRVDVLSAAVSYDLFD